MEFRLSKIKISYAILKVAGRLPLIHLPLDHKFPNKLDPRDPTRWWYVNENINTRNLLVKNQVCGVLGSFCSFWFFIIWVKKFLSIGRVNLIPGRWSNTEYLIMSWMLFNLFHFEFSFLSNFERRSHTKNNIFLSYFLQRNVLNRVYDSYELELMWMQE